MYVNIHVINKEVECGKNPEECEKASSNSHTESGTKVSRILGGMAGSSILGRTWSCRSVETINHWAAEGQPHPAVSAASLMRRQAPSKHSARHLASKLAGHVCEQTLLYCQVPREHIVVHMVMSLNCAAWKLRLAQTARRLSRAKDSLASLEGLVNVRAS